MRFHSRVFSQLDRKVRTQATRNATTEPSLLQLPSMRSCFSIEAMPHPNYKTNLRKQLALRRYSLSRPTHPSPKTTDAPQLQALGRSSQLCKTQNKIEIETSEPSPIACMLVTQSPGAPKHYNEQETQREKQNIDVAL